MRAAIDTNVLIAGLLWRGPPHTLLRHARSGKVSLVSSPTLLDELADVLSRTKFNAILARSNTSRDQTLEEVNGLVELVAAPPLPRPVCRDPDDDELLALARAAGVDLIVSGDDDLLSLTSFEGIEIVTPAEAVRRIG